MKLSPARPTYDANDETQIRRAIEADAQAQAAALAAAIKTLQGVRTFDSFGAKGDGSDDSIAVQAALTAGASCGVFGKTYVVGDLVASAPIDLMGSTLQAKSGAHWIVKLGPGASIRNGNVTDPNIYTIRSTTLSALIAAGAIDTPKTFTVASAANIAVGRLVFITLTNGTHHCAKVSAVAGTSITILDGPPTGALNGATVRMARGLIIADQCLNGLIENITFPVAPVGLELINTVTPAYSHEMTIRGIAGDNGLLCAIFLDVQCANFSFSDIKVFGHATPGSGYGVVGVYQEGRSPGIYPTGGHAFIDTNMLTFETGWQLREPQLTTHVLSRADTCSGDGWNIGPAQNFGALQMLGCFAGACNRGMVFTNAAYTWIGGTLWTHLNTVTGVNANCDLYIDTLSSVYIDVQGWGPDRVILGGGNVNTGPNAPLSSFFGGVGVKAALEIVGLTAAANGFRLQSNTAGNSPILSVQGSDTNIDAYLLTKGTGAFFVQNNGAGTPKTQFGIGGGPANSDEFWQAKGAAAGTGAIIFTQGSAANVNGFLAGKGTGYVGLQANGATQFRVHGAAGVINNWVVQGSATGNPMYAFAEGPDTNIGMVMLTKGSGHFFVQNNAAGGPATLLDVSGPTNAAAYLTLTAAAAGGNPAIATTSGDLALSPAGNIRYGTYTAAAIAQAGWIPWTDNAGVVRKVLIG